MSEKLLAVLTTIFRPYGHQLLNTFWVMIVTLVNSWLHSSVDRFLPRTPWISTWSTMILTRVNQMTVSQCLEWAEYHVHWFTVQKIAQDFLQLLISDERLTANDVAKLLRVCVDSPWIAVDSLRRFFVFCFNILLTSVHDKDCLRATITNQVFI